MSTFEEKRLEKLKKIQKAVSDQVETKANEAMSTGQDGYGQDYVPSDLASMIMEKVRDADTVMAKMPAPIIMPTPTYTIPVEGDDMTWYATSEQADVTGTAVTTSKAGTNDLVLTAKKFSASTYASGELDDDSIINIRQFLGDKFAKSYSELLDAILINGDVTTAGTGNVNSDDGAPTAGTYYLHMDGLRVHALDNSLDVNAGGDALTLADIRAARANLGIRGTNPDDLLLVLPHEAYFGLLGLTQVETVEKFGRAATVVEGRLRAIDGIEVIPSSQIGLAEADGKQSTTGSNNTLGIATLIYKPDVVTGFKRNLQVFTEYLPQYDQFRFTGHVRYAQNFRGTSACAYIRNFTV